MAHVILWLVGCGMVAAMAWGIMNTFKQKRELEQDHLHCPDPGIGDLATAYSTSTTSTESGVTSTQEPEVQVFPVDGADVLDDPIVVLNIVAPDEMPFTGAKILEAFRQQQMVYGNKHLFHAFDDGGAVAFSAASAVEPGVFYLDNMESFSTPGLGFFMDIGQSRNPLANFNHMLRAVKAIAKTLSGTVLDADYQPLGPTAMNAYLARVKLPVVAHELETEVA